MLTLCAILVFRYTMQLATPWDDKLTTRQNLLYAAELRMVRIAGLTDSMIVNQVDQVMTSLKMQEYADVVVGGNDGGGGLSGGQKRKLSVAIQLLNAPEYLLLDEPTSGLDATSAMMLLQELKELSTEGHTILVTIHQPRVEVWNIFDEVVVLGAGRVCYHGHPYDAINHLTKVFASDAGVTLMANDPHINPADVLLDSLHDHRNQIFASTVYSHTQTHSRRLKALADFAVAAFQTTPGEDGGDDGHVTVRGWLWITWQLVRIEGRRMAGATRHLWPALVIQTLVVASTVGLVWWDVGTALVYLSGCFILIANPWTLMIVRQAVALTQHRQLVSCDLRDGALGTSHFIIAGVIYLAGQVFAASAIMCLIVLPMLGEVNNQQLLNVTTVHIMHCAIHNLFMLILVSLPGAYVEGVSSNAVTFNMMCGVLAGFVITRVQLEDSPLGETIGAALLEISPTYQSLALVANSLLHGRVFDCDFNSRVINCGPTSPFAGESMIVVFGFHKSDNGTNLSVLVGYTALFALVLVLIPWMARGKHAPETPDTAACDIIELVTRYKQALQPAKSRDSVGTSDTHGPVPRAMKMAQELDDDLGVMSPRSSLDAGGSHGAPQEHRSFLENLRLPGYLHHASKPTTKARSLARSESIAFFQGPEHASIEDAVRLLDAQPRIISSEV